MDRERLYEIYSSNRAAINGALIGFIIAVVILLIGFLKALFILVFVLAGYFIGKKLSEDKDYIKNLLDKILPPGTYR